MGHTEDPVSFDISSVITEIYDKISEFDGATQISILKLIERLLHLFDKRDAFMMQMIEAKISDVIHHVKILEFDLYATKLELSKYKDNA